MKNTFTSEEHELFTGVNFASPSWRLARFEIEADPALPTRAWLIAHLPIGVSCRITFCRSHDVAELLLDALLIAQAAYARTAVRSARNDN